MDFQMQIEYKTIMDSSAQQTLNSYGFSSAYQMFIEFTCMNAMMNPMKLVILLHFFIKKNLLVGSAFNQI